jgi:hypothetical protein
MEPYPVDVEAKQILRWLADEKRLHGFDLLVTATRSYQSKSLDHEDSWLGDSEREI